MKYITNKSIWNKIVIILVFIILFEFTFTSPVQATEATVLLSPIVNLFVSLGDGVMNLTQNILLQQIGDGGESLIKIQDNGGGIISKIIVALVFIVGTAVAVIGAIPSGGTSLALVAFAGKAIFAIAVSGYAYASTYSILENFVEGTIGTTYYLPMYEVTPYEIFADKVLLFDADFFDPKDDKISESTIVASGDIKDKDYDIGYEIYDSNGELLTYNGKIENNGSSTLKFNDSSPDELVNYFANEQGKKATNMNAEVSYSEGKEVKEYCLENTYSTLSNGQYTGYYKTLQTYNFKMDDEKYTLRYIVYYYNGWTGQNSFSEEKHEKLEQSTARQLQSTVATWYLAFRNIALVALLSVLVYIGIRIMLCSVASDKAKYKQMLVDWAVAICLVFLMHYIMSFSVTISKKITEAFSSVTTTTENTDDIKAQLNKVGGFENAQLEKINEAVEIFVISDPARVKDAWKSLVDNLDKDNKGNSQYKQYFFTDSKLENHSSGEDDAKVLVWPANNVMEQARMKLQMLRGDGETKRIESYGYAIIFVVLIVYTIIFAFTYLKRVIYLAFLTIIAPLVAITYPIDKINDGQAQAFNMWLKEYIFNLLIQPLHLMLYIILIGSAMAFAARNIFYVVLALGFFVPAEKMLRRFFGFDKAETPGIFGGAAGAGIMMAGINKLMNSKPPKHRLGSGEKEKDENNNKISTYDDKTVDFDKPLLGSTPNIEKIKEEKENKEEKEQVKYHDKLNKEQIDELNADGIEPGDQEYDQYLRNHGINPTKIPENTQTKNDKALENKKIEHKKAEQANQQNKLKRSKIRGFKQGVRSYRKGMKKKLQQRYKAKGSLAKRGIRMAGGLAGAATLAAAGGIVGITSGDLTKGLQYMGTGAVGGYKLGTTGVDKASDAVKVKDTIKNAKEAYYGDEYKEKQQEQYKKDLIKDEEFLQKIEQKFNIERKEAKEKAIQLANYSDKKGIQSVDDLIKLGVLTKGGKNSIDDAIKAIGYNNLALDGKNTNTLSSEEYEKYMERYKERLMKNGKVTQSQAEASARKMFSLMDEANKI